MLWFSYICITDDSESIMKNLLITIFTITVSFSITYYVLNVVQPLPETETKVTTQREHNKTSSAQPDEDSDSADYSNDAEENDSESIAENDNNDLLPDVGNLLMSVDDWKSYYKENIQLSSDFIPLNEEGEEIDKGDFLSDLTTGSFVPVKLLSGVDMYQLYELEDDTDSDIIKLVKNDATVTYEYFLKEGTQFPTFDLTDLNGENYSSDTTAEKILIVYCWFISSKESVQQLPKLNDLYDKYEAYDDVAFLSLAVDQADNLKSFLTKQPFRYPVVASQKAFMQSEIGVSQYPTHIIVNEQGEIEKMLTNVEELDAALENINSPDLEASEEF